jgi:hypothetical protein
MWGHTQTRRQGGQSHGGPSQGQVRALESERAGVEHERRGWVGGKGGPTKKKKMGRFPLCLRRHVTLHSGTLEDTFVVIAAHAHTRTHIHIRTRERE